MPGTEVPASQCEVTAQACQLQRAWRGLGSVTLLAGRALNVQEVPASPPGARVRAARVAANA